MILLQVTSCHLFEAYPVLGVQHAYAELFESDFLFKVEGIILRRNIAVIYTFAFTLWLLFFCSFWLKKLVEPCCLEFDWLFWLLTTSAIYWLHLGTGVPLIVRISDFAEYVATPSRWGVSLTTIDLRRFIYANSWATESFHSTHWEMDLLLLHSFLQWLFAMDA